MFKRIFAVVLIASVIAIPVLAAETKETAYERVMRTRTLRCGYFAENPFTIINPNTGRKSGIAVDLTETIAAQLGLKVEWTEEINLGTYVTDLQNGRYDAICGSILNTPRAGKMDVTTPYLYMPSYGYVRADDKRFDSYNKINRKDFTMAILDGEGSSAVASRIYPDARQYALPQSAEISQTLLAVADKKADVAFALPSVYDQFNATNPGKLKQISSANPFYVFSVSFGLRPNEPALKDMFDMMIRQLVVSGEMDLIIDRYEPKPGMFLRLAKPYGHAAFQN